MLYRLDMTIGVLIKQARKAKGLSLEALGEKLGVTRQLVWQWEKGDSDPRKHIQALSLHLNVPVEYFYGPKRAPSIITAKIEQLSPTERDLVEMMIDKLLEQHDVTPSRKTDVK
jgi:transcriptional regulator with XRE-family HTH domain